MLNGGPVTILLVEDDPAHAEIVKRNMADCRIANDLYHVADGQAAWPPRVLRWKATRPDPR
jgi:hypothetical protein